MHSNSLTQAIRCRSTLFVRGGNLLPALEATGFPVTCPHTPTFSDETYAYINALGRLEEILNSSEVLPPDSK